MGRLLDPNLGQYLQLHDILVCLPLSRNTDHTLVAYLAVAVTLQLKAGVCVIEHRKSSKSSKDWSLVMAR